jgi:FAD/FMN-containing dehydrogenase
MNGSSLPQAGEVLVETRGLKWARYERLGTVTCGAGLRLWALAELVHQHGYSLPVMNDGYAGPTAGGYLAAGGFGAGSASHGGFWENVEEIVLVTASGAKRISRQDASFPWMFGAMGQLGLVVELTLTLSPGRLLGPYPQGYAEPSHQIQTCDARASGAPAEEADRPLYWFTCFVAERDLAEASAALAVLRAQHSDALTFREPYTYVIRHCGRVVAPLVYATAEDFCAVGMWGSLENTSVSALQRLGDLEAAFMSLVLQKGYRRYVQSELVSGSDAYRSYFEPSVFARFAKLKCAVDPACLFNADSVFPRID